MDKSEGFVKNSIKNDLRRASKWAVEAGENLPIVRIQTFLQHAQGELSKLGGGYQGFAAELQHLAGQAEKLSDPLSRVRWAEKVLTLSCRL